jgi:hypothetical protein
MPKLQQRSISIKMFVPDGDPDGLCIVEKSTWTGVGGGTLKEIQEAIRTRASGEEGP